jgi:hypothetical protein
MKKDPDLDHNKKIKFESSTLVFGTISEDKHTILILFSRPPAAGDGGGARQEILEGCPAH